MGFWNHAFCHFCGDPVSEHREPCGPPEIWEGDRCRICGQSLLGETGDLCWFCRGRPWSLDRSYFAGIYKDRWRLLLQEYKIQKHWYLGRFISGYMAPLITQPWPLVVVPGNPRNNRERGFDPVEILCRELVRINGNPVIQGFQRQPGKSQKALGKSERHESIRRGIGWAESGPKISGSVYLLDDIFTTGATADHCASVLKAQGADQVVLVAAAGP